MYITAHTDYALYINGDLHSFGQYADYPDQVKIYDTVDISDALSEGPNSLVITGYSQRVGSSTQTDAVSGILYVITEDGTEESCEMQVVFVFFRYFSLILER